MLHQLHKGDCIDLAHQNIVVGLGWECPKHASGHQFDLDASAFLLNVKEKMPDVASMVYYDNLQSPDGAVQHSGDNRVGDLQGDDEHLQLDLSLVNTSISSIVFMVSIHEAEMKHQHFGMVRDAYIRIFNSLSGEELVRYELKEALRFFETAEFGRLRRHGNGWQFVASGLGHHGGLKATLLLYR